MMNIEFTRGETFISRLCGESVAYTPVYALLNGENKFVKNISNALYSDTFAWRDYSNKKSLAEVEESKNNLMLHDGKYITFHALYDNPFDFLNWVKENNYTLEVVKKFFAESESGDYTDFHGNCREYSCAFHYRIYDESMIKKLKGIVSDMKQHIR